MKVKKPTKLGAGGGHLSSKPRVKAKAAHNLPVLRVFVSETERAPDERTAQQVFSNFGTRILIRSQRTLETIESEGPSKPSGSGRKANAHIPRDCFDADCIYLTLFAETSCTVSISFSFLE